MAALALAFLRLGDDNFAIGLGQVWARPGPSYDEMSSMSSGNGDETSAARGQHVVYGQGGCGQDVCYDHGVC